MMPGHPRRAARCCALLRNAYRSLRLSLSALRSLSPMSTDRQTARRRVKTITVGAAAGAAALTAGLALGASRDGAAMTKAAAPAATGRNYTLPQDSAPQVPEGSG